MRRFFLTGLAVSCFILSQCGGATFSGGAGDASADRTAADTGGTGKDSGHPGRDSGGTHDTGVDTGSQRDTGGGMTGHDSGHGADSGQHDAGGSSCTPACVMGRECCDGACVNEDNDPHHCGGCGTACSGTDVCASGMCTTPPCSTFDCPAGETCCGGSCCTAGEICCLDEGPVEAYVCFMPTAAQPTCPAGCAPECISDRNVKRDIVPVDDRAVLEALARVPVSTWSYTSDDPSVRHLGPMAQDLHEAFGLGDTDRAYSPIDAHGIAMASIKALYEMSLEQKARIDRLEAENAALKKAILTPKPAR